MKKYDTIFNFFFQKSITQIIYNHNQSQSTLYYKDIIVFNQNNQYLKRIYHFNNHLGRNQINDRIEMLSEFYSNTVSIKYQLPMMILTNTKDIFLKRIKRMKKMTAYDCSSQETSSHHFSQNSRQQSFSTSILYKTIKSQEIQQDSHNDDQFLAKNQEKSFDGEIYDIFQQQCQQNKNFSQKIDISTNQNKLQKTVNHLIVDIDDIDKQKVLMYYKKYQQHQPKPLPQNPKKPKQLFQKKSNIIITALDTYPKNKKQQQNTSPYYPKINKFNKRQTIASSNRYKQQIYDQTIRVGNQKNWNYIYDNQKYYNYHSKYRLLPSSSPSFGGVDQRGNQTQRNPNNYQNHYVSPNFRQQAQPKKFIKQRIYTQHFNSPSHFQVQPLTNQPSPKNRYQFLNQIPTQQNQTIYLTHENSVIEGEKRKKNMRERATIFLEKARSLEKLPMLQEPSKRNMNKYQPYQRFTSTSRQ